MAMHLPHHTLDVNVMGIRLRLIAPDQDVVAFAARFTGMAKRTSGSGEPQIVVTLCYGEPRVDEGDMRKVSRSMWIGPSRLFLAAIERFPGLSLAARQQDEVLHVQAFFTPARMSIVGRLAALRGGRASRRQLFFVGLVYYLIYFPVWYYAEHFRHVSLMHAGAVQWQGRGVLLAGLGGIGKTTFALGALLSGGARFLSDNLVFHNARSVRAVPEPIALDVKHCRGLGPVEECLEPIKVRSTHGRAYYHVKEHLCVSEIEPAVVLWLQSGRENRMVAMDPAQCAARVAHINFLAKEVREYYVMSAVFDLAFDSPLTMQARGGSLKSLLAGRACYVLEFRPGDDLRRVLDETVGRVPA